MQEVVALLLGLEAGLDHREERLATLVLERDRHLALDRAAVPLAGRHGVVEHQSARPVDLGERADLDVGLLALHPHRVDRGAADPDVGLAPADHPARLPGTVQLLLCLGVHEGVEDDLRGCVVQPLETQLVAHGSSPSVLDGWDVLVAVEQVARVVPSLDRREPIPRVAGVGLADAASPSSRQEVDVRAWRVASDHVVEAGNPRLVDASSSGRS